MGNDKVKWSGGSYGECPYIKLGDKVYFIQDRKAPKGDHYQYALMMKRIGEGFDYEFRRQLSDWDYGELSRAVSVFERWFRIRFNSKPLQVFDGNNGVRRYERGHLVFWVEKPYGKSPKIICRSTGQIIDGFYDSMRECKYYADRIMKKEIEAYKESLEKQLAFDFENFESEEE